MTNIFRTLTPLLYISTLVVTVLGQTINTPSLVVSGTNYDITFSGGTPPFTIAIIPGGSIGGPPSETFTDITCSPYTWFVTEPAGSTLFLRLTDSSGASVTTAPFTVQPQTSA